MPGGVLRIGDAVLPSSMDLRCFLEDMQKTGQLGSGRRVSEDGLERQGLGLGLGGASSVREPSAVQEASSRESSLARDILRQLSILEGGD
jgi:hypothetical protein